MYLAKKEDNQELKPDMTVKFPSSDEISEAVRFLDTSYCNEFQN